ncbi:SETD7 [Lepeophtheirus salmonis]|uniref:SETD7 n=1 Tax=Lepeophtheirus salmonis TaxID=72036 RepID=A0A7R8HCH3_LEPSM|nr:SETD7 [Lepeophtheirus salmonis]CAF3005010.1 SETD7 [Lepeophtheirus salmonis]
MSRVCTSSIDTCVLNLEIQRQERRRRLARLRNDPDEDDEEKNESEKQNRSFLRKRLPPTEVRDKMGNLIYRRGESDQERYSRELEQWIRKMKCTGNGGMRLEQFKDIKVGLDTNPIIFGSPSLEPYPNIYKEPDYKFKGGKDENGRWKGKGVIEFANGDTISGSFQNGYRHGECKIETNRLNLRALAGTYENDRLCGKAKLVFQNDTSLEGYFLDGVLHGFVRYFDAKGRLTFIGNHRNGRPHGPCWKVVKGGGCVVGRVNESGELTGIRIAYIFPDYQTALVGTFTKGVLEYARVAYLKTVVEDRGIKVPIFSEPSGCLYEHEIIDYDSKIKNPLLPDPYESRLVEVKQSNVPGANDGLFAKIRIEASTVVAFYYGKPVLNADLEDKDDWGKNAYKIFDPSRPNGTMDIPVEFRDIKNYCATLAHKTNHSFLPNAEFLSFDHPRFGVIPCLVTNHDVEAGEEIFVHYGYDMDGCPDWYEVVWLQGTYPVPESLKEGWDLEQKKSNIVNDSVSLSNVDMVENGKSSDGNVKLEE